MAFLVGLLAARAVFLEAGLFFVVALLKETVASPAVPLGMNSVED